MCSETPRPPRWSDRAYIRLRRRDIAYVRFILESYDHLALISILDKYEAVAQLNFSPQQRSEVFELIAALEQEIGLQRLELPPAGA
jgi:hypothetical protein